MRISDWSSDVCSSDLLAAEDIRSVVASTDGFSASPPAFIGRKHFPELLALRVDQGARTLLSHGVQVETMGASLIDIVNSEERRVGNECVMTCRAGGAQYLYNKYTTQV